MRQTIEAVYEGGVFKPLRPVKKLKNFTHVRLTVEPLSKGEVNAILDLAFATYEGLTEQQIAQIEAARFDQDDFFRRA